MTSKPFGKFADQAEKAIAERYGQDVWNIFPIVFEYFPGADTNILLRIGDDELSVSATENIIIHLNNRTRDDLSLRHRGQLGKLYRIGPDFPVVYYATHLSICHHETGKLKQLAKNLSTIKLTEIIET